MAVGLDKTTLEYLYLHWTIQQNIPFDMVRDTHFWAFLGYFNPIANQMLPDSDVTMRRHAESLFSEGKKRLRHILATDLSDIHLTCDLWTSPNHLGLLAVVAHFTSKKSKLQSVTLALKELEREHLGKNQAAIVLDVLNDYGIHNKLSYMVSDNAGTNDTLIEIIADSLHEEGVFYDVKQQYL